MSLYLGTQKISDVNTHFEGYEGIKQEKTVSPNDTTQVVTPDAGADALSKVTVNRIPSTYIGSGISKQAAKTVTPSAATQTAVSAGVYTSGAVTVAPVPAETKSITQNGTYTPADGKWFSSVDVNVAGDSFETQDKTVTPTEEQQIVTPDSGKDGLSSVIVEAIPNDYIGSAIPNTNGYPGTGMFISNPYITNASINVGRQVFVTGDVLSKSYLDQDNIFIPVDNPYKISETIAPTEESQTAVAAGTYVAGDIVVDAIPNDYIGSAIPALTKNDIGTPTYWNDGANRGAQMLTIPFSTKAYVEPGDISITLGASNYFGEAQQSQVITGADFTSSYGLRIQGTMPAHTSGTTTFASITKSGTNMVVASGIPTDGYGYYSSNAAISTSIPASNFGTATASHVLSGDTFTSENGVKMPGSLVIQKYYTGSSTPSNSLGENGDLYFKLG